MLSEKDNFDKKILKNDIKNWVKEWNDKQVRKKLSYKIVFMSLNILKYFYLQNDGIIIYEKSAHAKKYKIFYLLINPNKVNQGIGYNLMTRLINAAKNDEDDIHYIVWNIDTKDGAFIPFAESFGFFHVEDYEYIDKTNNKIFKRKFVLNLK